MPTQSNPFTALAYGPVVGERGPSQMIGAYGNRLGPMDVAISPGMLSQYPMGSTLPIRDAQGNPLGNYRVADTSWYAPGNPTSNTIEFRDANRSGNVFIGSPSSQSSSSPFEWYPKEGGMLGKIASHLPGASTYLAGQTVFDFIRNGLSKLFGGGSGQQQQGAYSGIPDNLQPTNPGFSFAPGFGSPGIPDNLQPTNPGYNFAPGFGPPGAPNAPTPFVPPPEFGGPGFGSYAQAQNNFVPGLIDWNGPGQANPTGGEPGVSSNYNALAARLGLMGRGAGGKLPVSFL